MSTYHLEKEFEKTTLFKVDNLDDYRKGFKETAMILVQITDELIGKDKGDRVKDYFRQVMPGLDLSRLRLLVAKQNSFRYIIANKIEVLLSPYLDRVHRFIGLFGGGI